jgi:hypothetical protein
MTNTPEKTETFEDKMRVVNNILDIQEHFLDNCHMSGSERDAKIAEELDLYVQAELKRQKEKMIEIIKNEKLEGAVSFKFIEKNEIIDEIITLIRAK